MDDPWANAWGEPSKSNLPDIALSPSWSAPSVSVLHGDNEDDLSAPSWSMKPATQWNDPDVSEASLWINEISTSAWNPPPSTFDRISLNADSAEQEQPLEAEPPLQTSVLQGFRDFRSPSPPSTTVTPPTASPPPRIKTPDFSPHPPVIPQSSPFIPSILIPPVDDIDGFGTFETAPETAESAGWSPSKPTLSLPSDAAAWGATWEEAGSGGTGENEEVDDAWELARQQKAKQDQHVPPELLASILRQLEELTKDLWSDPSVSENEQGRVDLEDLGLNSVKLSLIPEDLVLPMNIPFEKTFTTKRLSEALRLTRHSPLTRSSPMALYMSSKGSTSWEASIKAKPNITQDDITPAGWKVLEPVKEVTSVANEGKKKTSGGLLSFFGRKATNIPSEPATESRPSSPATVPAVATIKTGASPRASLDSIRGQSPVLGRSTPAVPVSFSLSGTTAQPFNDSNSNLGIVPEYDNEDPIPAPSVVSRFLGRFSTHSKSSSSRDPIPLSADDLEFLSDVPTIHSDAPQGPPADALTMMIKSPPLPTALPLPLSPPPKAPLPSHSSSHYPPLQDRQRSSNDFSFFDDLEAGRKTMTGSPLSPLTTAPMPPVKPPLRQPSLTSIMNSSPSHSANPTPIADHTQPCRDNEQSSPSFDHPSMSMNKPAPPQAKRSFVPIMSSTRTSSDTPLPLPKPGSTFALPPPPPSSHRSSSSSPAAGSSTVISPLPPPPSRSHTPFHALQPPPTIIDEDDDFSDFLSSPSQATQPVPLSFADFVPAPSLAPIPSHPPTTSNTLLDDFTNSPPPPKPPAKTAPSATQLSGPALRPPSKPAAHPNQGRKVFRKADHSRTLSLMETAAARGRWLAPPSPLPEALPPPDASNGKSLDIDLGSGHSTMQAQQAQAAATLAGIEASSVVPSNGHGNSHGWNFFPPLNNPPVVQPTSNKPPPPQPLFTGLHVPTFQPSQAQNGSAVSSATKSGGLSAQDISFFEGL